MLGGERKNEYEGEARRKEERTVELLVIKYKAYGMGDMATAGPKEKAIPPPPPPHTKSPLIIIV